ncbi:MAG: hypothetical protein M1832_001995 [Thelocarpon impressellum]|nr:MAG: hypothetical protein M1832_001995 [Thelocarpon impressellum]
MAPAANDGSTVTGPWKVADIVYVAIVGTVMIAAFLEWFLGLAAFLYCLIKVFKKAENWATRLLSVIMMIAFTALRGIFLPVMVVTLPLPSRVTQYFPAAMVSFLQWFAFWTFAGLLTIPWLFCVYQLVTNGLGRKKRIKYVLDETTAPKVVIVMPCYKEVPEVLVTAIDSVVDCDYPPTCLHVFLSFDGDQEDDLYLRTIEKLGVPLSLDSYPPSIDVKYRGTRITVSRFPHGGKRHCQKRTFKLIDKIYTDYLKRNDNLFILFIDSDCILDKVCIQNFVYEMELKPGSKQNMLAMTGVITSTTEKNTLITLLQDMEYIHGQLFERSVESGCGSVTCLPGALTILRFSAFRNMAKYYFADKAEQCDDLFDYGKCHLGEDRWLTHLFMIGAQDRYQIGMCTGAFCKTEAVQTYQSLLKQRRRWFLGFITNEACMLTDLRLWLKYPILCTIRFMQNTIRTTALLFFIMVLSVLTTSNKIGNLPVGFIAVSLGLNWLLMIYFGFRLRRYKALLYPIMFVINPFFNWVYMVYGICTAGQRTWGGPRADAGTADTSTTVREAIEHAEATGDDLNVVPETFKPAVEASTKRPRPMPLQPSDRVAGRFAPAELLPGGWYQQRQDSTRTLPDMLTRDPDAAQVRGHGRHSFDSFLTNTSGDNSIYMPRRIESILSEEDTQMYRAAQVNQREAGGAYLLGADEHGRIYSSDSSPSGSGEHYEAIDLNHDDAGGRRAGRGGGEDYGTVPTQEPQASGAPVQSASDGTGRAADGPATLTVPEVYHGRRAQRRSVASRISRSPLARLTFSRSFSSDDADVELQQQQQDLRLMGSEESAGEGPSSSAAAAPAASAASAAPPKKSGRKKLTKAPRKPR